MKSQRRLQQRKRETFGKQVVQGLMVLVVTVSAVLAITWCLNPNLFAQQAARDRVSAGNNMVVTRNLQQKITKSNKMGKVEYGDSSSQTGDISPEQLKRDAQAGYPLYKLGEIAIPKQAGVLDPIHVSIFEGTSVTVLAYGAGTAKAGEKMGQGNYALSAHNMADNVTYFSPLQNKLHTDERPYAYVTNKKVIYRYRIFNQQHQPKGKVIVPLTDVSVLDEPNNGLAQLTLTTCYEIPPAYANATKRVIIRGELTQEVSWNRAPNSWRALFK